MGVKLVKDDVMRVVEADLNHRNKGVTSKSQKITSFYNLSFVCLGQNYNFDSTFTRFSFSIFSNLIHNKHAFIFSFSFI